MSINHFIIIYLHVNMFGIPVKPLFHIMCNTVSEIQLPGNFGLIKNLGLNARMSPNLFTIY